MRSLRVTALAAIVASVSAAAIGNSISLSTSSSNEGGFTIDQVGTGKTVLRNGAADIAKTYRKYGKEPPTNVVKAAAAAAVQSGSVTATPEAYNEAYLCPVQIGTPAQTLYMDFDTGSSDFWVFSNYTPSSQRSGHLYYSPGSSSTSRYLSGEKWSVSYGDGSSSSGYVYSDKVVIGGVTATSQAVEVATTVSSSFVSDTSNDGLVGLAFDDLNTCTPSVCSTFIESVAPSLPSPLFAAYLKRGAAGAYDFGYINSAHYSGTIYYVNVIDKSSYGYWTTQGSGYAINGGAETTSSFPVIVDTGTSLIYLPAAAVSAYYAKVSGSQNSATYGGYVFPCSATLPSFTIYLGSLAITVAGSKLNYAPVSGSTCLGAIQSSSGIGINILGDAFINNFYVIFDYISESATSQIGFALQA